MSQRRVRVRRAEALRLRVDDSVLRSSGEAWSSVVSSALVAGALAFTARAGRRERWLQWRSLWGTDPRVTPDLVHFEAFVAWLLFAYPLLVVITLALWAVDALSDAEPPGWAFFGLVGFALVSGAFHYVRGRMDLRTTRAAQLVAGWPQEAIVLGTCLGVARLAIGA